MKKVFTVIYCAFMGLYAPTFSIALTLDHHAWSTPQIILMALIGICGFFAALVVWQGRTSSRKLRVKQPASNERSSLFILPHGDELLLTDGSDIIAHLPNKQL